VIPDFPTPNADRLVRFLKATEMVLFLVAVPPLVPNRLMATNESVHIPALSDSGPTVPVSAIRVTGTEVGVPFTDETGAVPVPTPKELCPTPPSIDGGLEFGTTTAMAAQENKVELMFAKVIVTSDVPVDETSNPCQPMIPLTPAPAPNDDEVLGVREFQATSPGRATVPSTDILSTTKVCPASTVTLGIVATVVAAASS
jgi:hypothetical protein